MLISRRRFDWNNVLSPNWWAFNRGGGGPISERALRYLRIATFSHRRISIRFSLFIALSYL